MTWQRNEGYRPRTGASPLRVRFRCGWISKNLYPAAKWTRWHFKACPFDITHFKIED
ncbi:hypothetical protein [Sphingopyxis yananensis]|uniref:hypothetical protein n=1 Tax=Sphingopyxis yananensis TaxID=2886687 RepID=UPI001D12FDEB|nr:hypothetical protein [Sphingopyxis yananensis]MCC2602560.1 hypothetical protein [Sphingopyxis yananensis]